MKLVIFPIIEKRGNILFKDGEVIVFILENFLLNVFFIMFPLIFYQFSLQDHFKQKTFRNNVLTYFIFAVPTILCMIFPVSKHDGMLYDLRYIPLILLNLYGHSALSFILVLTIVGIRFTLGGIGAFYCLMSVGIIFIFALYLKNGFHSSSLTKKIALASLLCFCGKGVSMVVHIAINPYFDLMNFLFIYGLQGFIMGLTVYIIESIRRSVQLSKDLIESEKMKVASVISASVAHEIRNPLTSVRGFIQLLSSPSQLPEEKKTLYGQVCLEELDRAEQIINDYLSLSKPQYENNEVLNIKDEVQYVCNVLNSYANLKGVEIQDQLNLHSYVMGDRQKFRQCMINIMKNGIEAMNEGGILRISAINRNGHAILSISDSGPGMTASQIERLGKPYFSTKEKGTGLGTMVSFNIIKNMKGAINVYSQIGSGTTFEITLPLVQLSELNLQPFFSPKRPREQEAVRK